MSEIKEAVERLELITAKAAHLIRWTESDAHDLAVVLSALQEARADADLCASSWTKEIEARNATASIARRFHAALQEIASGEVGPEQEGHYLAHRRAVKTARKAIGALSPGGADE